MKYTYRDSTNQGIVNGSTPTYRDWDSEWDYTDGVLTCTKLSGCYTDNMLEVLKDKTKEDYMSIKRAYNRHKAEIEKQIGIYVEKKVKQVPMEKVIYRDYKGFGVATIKKGAKTISDYKNPPKTPWTEQKQIWVDEYNANEIKFRGIQRKLSNKIFEEEDDGND